LLALSKEELENELDDSVHSCIHFQTCRGIAFDKICWCKELEEKIKVHDDPYTLWDYNAFQMRYNQL